MGDTNPKVEISPRLREQLQSADPIIAERAVAELAELKAAARADEQVDHPQHYGGADDPYETIKVLEAWLTPEQMMGFCIGNAIKYVSRAGKKDKAKTLEDRKKAQWYLDYAIKLSTKQAAEDATELAERLVHNIVRSHS